MKRTFCPARMPAILFFLTLTLFTASVSNAQTYTMFEGTDVPSVLTFNDGPAAIVTGTKFQVTQPGTVSAVRFYRGSAADNQLYTAYLYDITSSTVTPVRTGTHNVTGSPAAGWRQISLSSSYHLTTGRTYVVAVQSPNGNYSASVNPSTDVLDDEDITGNPPFIIIGAGTSVADPANPGNGVYAYAADGGFPYPSNNGNTANYWIDVVFTTDFALPVSLSDFTAATTGNDVTLSWKTATETNNRGFEVQRSNNNADWYSVQFVNGAGASSSVRNYGYVDKGLAPGVYYYRLVQTDFDGRTKTSTVVSATISGKGMVSLFQNYPNPFSGSTTIRFDLPSTQRARLSIFDMMGREVKVLVDGNSQAGSHLVSFDSKGLSPQLYSIRLSTDAGVLSRQVLVQ